jgi:hypothetical protein
MAGAVVVGVCAALRSFSFAGSNPDLEATEGRLLRNQVDLGNAIKPFYGQAAGNQLTKLLTLSPALAATRIATAPAMCSFRSWSTPRPPGTPTAAR